jgi:hypothetical protein
MRTSNKILRTLLVCGLAGPLHADNLTLAGGAVRLSGSVRSINEAGVVELSSTLSPTPLLLKSGAVDKVEFTDPGAAPVPPAAMIELANGDLLPAIIEALDETNLTATSPEAGRLEIPRAALRSMQLGIRKHKVVYSGPRSLEEWAGGDDVGNWGFERNALVANGPGSASKKIALPQQFILKFKLAWQIKQLPNFQVYFADPLKPKGEASDRYFFRFSGAGLDIQREASKGKHYSPVVQLGNRTPNQFPDRQLQVEIRVDRKGSRLQLFLNGEPEGMFIDPIPSAPLGSGIILASTAPNGTAQEISDIQVIELDDSRTRHRTEERGDPKSDSLISREDDRWGGHLIEIRKNGGETVFHFKSDFQNDPLEIPDADVSTVFFAVKSDDNPAGKKTPFVLRLRGEGRLQVTSCRFTEDAVFAAHPLLGALKFPREGIVAMERTDAESKTTPEP